MLCNWETYNKEHGKDKQDLKRGNLVRFGYGIGEQSFTNVPKCLQRFTALLKFPLQSGTQLLRQVDIE